MQAGSLPHSLYADTARPPVETAPLHGRGAASVAIVGGGITGLSTALHLAEAGIDAVVLERHEPGWGASGRNGGQVNPGLYPDPGKVLSDFGAEMGGRMLALAADAPGLVFRLIERHGIACAAARTGTLRVAINRTGLAGARETCRQWRDHVGEADWLDEAGVAAATGTGRYAGGILFPQGGKLNPLSYTRGLAEAAVSKGARVHGASPVEAMEGRGADWILRTPQGELTARHVVLATNGYTDNLWPRLKRTIVPVYGAIVATEPLPESLARRILPAGSVLYETGRTTVYYRLDEARRFLIGGRGRQGGTDDFGSTAHLSAYAATLWPELAAMRWKHVWNGQIAVTSDRHIHFHELAENVYASIGYNGRGVAMATAMGAVIARRIGGEAADSLPMPMTPQPAPIPFHAFWKVGVGIRLSLGRLRDRFDP